MSRLTLVVCLSVALVTFSAAAKPPKGAQPPTTQKPRKAPTDRVGMVLKVEPGRLTVQTYGKAASEIVVAVDEKTQVQINGKPATVAQIKPGMEVVISPPTGTAQKVLAEKPGKGKKKDKDKDKKKKSPGTTPAPAPAEK